MEDPEIAAIVERIAGLLEAGREQSFAAIVRNALSGSDNALEDFLRSNVLWGGSGSIADQCLAGEAAKREELERLLIQLGKIQLKCGIANVRTKSWVEAFEAWQKLRI